MICLYCTICGGEKEPKNRCCSRTISALRSRENRLSGVIEKLEAENKKLCASLNKSQSRDWTKAEIDALVDSQYGS